MIMPRTVALFRGLPAAHRAALSKASWRADETYKALLSLDPREWLVETVMEQRRKLERLLADSPLKYLRDGQASSPRAVEDSY